MIRTSSLAAAPARLCMSVLVILCFTAWSLLHSYEGLFHDARLYTLQALAYLHPGSLSSDIFLKYGSQDRFTLFSPIYAAAAHALGIEHGAALLTLLFQISALGCAYALARSVLSAPMALAGVAALLSIPGNYGAHRIFSCIEPFLTPRMAAEALVLMGLAAALRSRRLQATILMTLAVLMHPVMAAGGIAGFFCLYVALPRPKLAAALGAMGFVAIGIWALVLPQGTWGRFDDGWLALIEHRSPYLFLQDWQLDDWSNLAVSLATLLLCSRLAPSPTARILSTLSALVVMSGLALTLVACDLLHLVVFTQAQPWRWQWLGTVVAALLLPSILGTLWNDKLAGRTGAVLLCAAWVFASNVYGLFSACAALLAVAVMNRLKPSEARWIAYGAWGLLFIAIAWRIASNLEFTDSLYLESSIPLWIRRAVSFTHDGCTGLAIIALTWKLAQWPRGRAALMAIAVLALALSAALLPQTWKNWSQREFSPSQIERFSSLRDHIPAGADVYWPNLPLATWILLDHPSYISIAQTSGMVFSRQSAFELEHRAEALRSVIPPDTFMSWNSTGDSTILSRPQLRQICELGAVGYLVTSTDLGVRTKAILTVPTGPTAGQQLHLYHCPAPPD